VHGIKGPLILGNIELLNKRLIGRQNILRNTLHIFAACSTLIRSAINTYWQLRLQFEAAQHSVPHPQEGASQRTPG
jgi:hypothetical protein